MSQLRSIVDKLLTGVSSAYIPKGYISEMILPGIQSAQYSGVLGKYGSNHLRIENALKGGRGKYRRVETIVRSTQGYLIEGHGLEGFVSKEDYANVYDPFDAERDETLGLSTVLWLEKEKMLADTIMSTAIVTQNVSLAGAAQFSDYANSDPVGVVTDAINTVLNASGQEPNLMVMDKYVFNKIKYHPQLLVALGYRYARPGGLKVDEVAEALGVEKLLLGMARYNSAKEGQTAVLSAVWGKGIFLGVLPPKPQVMQKSFGYLVRPTGSSPRKIYKQTNFNPPGSTAILCEDEYEMLVSDTTCGYLINTAVA